MAIFTIVKMVRGGWLREIIDDEGERVSVASSEFDDVIDVGYVSLQCFILPPYARFSQDLK